MESTSMSNPLNNLFKNYIQLPNNFDEIFSSPGEIRHNQLNLLQLLQAFNKKQYHHLHQQAIQYFLEKGVTFGTACNPKNTFPFDLIPRIIEAQEWEYLQSGLKQRAQALNAFLYDIYHEQYIIHDRIIPQELITSSKYYRPELHGLTPKHRIYIHVAGIDIVRNTKGQYLVLEDNLRIPSGVTYALTNRAVMHRLFAEYMDKIFIQPIHSYPNHLAHCLFSLADMHKNDVAVVLTPGPLNSAYYEHTYLANHMKWPLVQGQDLYVENKEVFLKKDKKRVRVIYRRIEDDYLDPLFFNKDSVIGVPGLLQAYAAGNVVVANALGNGIADDKAVFAFVPAMIEYYLQQSPILPQVPTYVCTNPKDKAFVLAHMRELVIKFVDQSGGVGVLIGPQASTQALEEYKNLIAANPRRLIAQPLIELSSAPVWDGEKMVARRIDLRPFVLTGTTQWVMPGGLSRVALSENSYLVNSCQGGGSKDTWIIE